MGDSTAALGFVQLLAALEMNEDTVRNRYGTIPNAKALCNLVPSRSSFINIGELCLTLGTSTPDAASSMLARILDVPENNFRMVSLSKGISWARSKTWRHSHLIMSQSQRELDAYLLEDVIVPILYAGIPSLLGFNPRSGWRALGLKLPLMRNHKIGEKIATSGRKFPQQHQSQNSFSETGFLQPISTKVIYPDGILSDRTTGPHESTASRTSQEMKHQ